MHLPFKKLICLAAKAIESCFLEKGKICHLKGYLNDFLYFECKAGIDLN